MENVTLADGTVIRPLASHGERVEAVHIQEETWGIGFSEKVPAAILLVAEKTGGVAAAAFAPGGRMLGFIFGLTGVRDGALVHWSDILAVRKEAQGRSLGEALKRYQRDRCRAVGVDRMYWTYDPFVARNAHINLSRLGARVDEFIPDMYGTATNSPVHGSLGTDRFVVVWPVAAEATPLPTQFAGEIVTVAGRTVSPGTFPGLPHVAIAVPHDYASLLGGDVGVAREWRSSARRAFLHYFALGYRVTAFTPGHEGGDGDAAYLLSSE